MNCELIMIGSELLLGQVVDTNASYLARRLADIGMNVYYKTTVGDNLERMVAALKIATERADVVIASGGLGPTEDDLTREAVAKVLGLELGFRQELLDDIEAKFASRGLKMSPNNRRQAFVPEGATVFVNPWGTAPAFVVESAASSIICLPGVPAELEQIVENEVLAYLVKKFTPDGAVIMSRELKASGVGESTVDGRIGDLIRTSQNPTVGILAQAGVIVIRITAKAGDRKSASRMIDDMESRVRERIGHLIFGKNGDTLECVVSRLLKSIGMTLCVVETGTAGAVAQKLVAVNAPQVLGYEVLPRKRNVEMFLSIDKKAFEKLVADPATLARRMGSVARHKYRADIALVVLEATGFGSSRSWVLIDISGSERVQDVGLKGCDRWSQERLALVALEMTRKALLSISFSGEAVMPRE